jgi:predicted CxxxxCH...CXXCH cytochrome family protein
VSVTVRARSRWLLLALLAGLTAGCDRHEEETAGPARSPAAAAAATGTPVPEQPEAREAAAGFAGQHRCAACHEVETERWRGSHHDLAMAEPSEDSVLGDFSDVTFEAAGELSRFVTRDDGWWVEITNGDGRTQTHRIAYTFGADPLQQYLIEMPDGRLQAYGVAWDTRPASSGGQRWFHVYGDDPPLPGESIHWTGIDQNWNYMCADCHSTGYRKNYDAASDRFVPAWTDIDVACEACHGPGAAHVAWAETGGTEDDPGFPAGLAQEQRQRVSPPDGPTVRIEGTVNRQEVEACGRCHARRTALREPYRHGRPLADSFMPAFLTEPLYHPDGQIRDEVYVYGSFRQSRMYEAGVTCGDCHDPHSLQLRADGDQVCAQCHQPGHFEAVSHTGHDPGPDAPGCRDCHMPAQTYMVVDPRRDHSFRVPRPDLAASLGVTDACASCHKDRPPGWSAASVRDWLGRDAAGIQGFGEAFRRAGEGWPDAVPQLLAIADDNGQPAIVRGTALGMLARFPGRETFTRVAAGVYDDDPLVRLGAVEGAEGFPPETRRPLLEPLLTDPVLAVRAEAGRSLAAVNPATLSPAAGSALRKALGDYVQIQRHNADRPEARMNLGNLYADAGDFATAERQFRAALALDPAFVPAWSNLADLQRAAGDEAGAEATLRAGLEAVAEPAGLEHALGLLLVRAGRREEALGWLEKAAASGAADPRLGYVYAVALQDLGRPDEAIRELERVHELRPSDPDVLAALATFLRESGRVAEALRYAERLVALQPGNPEAVALRDALAGMADRP